MLSRISHGVRSTVNSASASTSNPTRTVLSSCSCSRLSFTPSSSSSSATSTSHRTFSTDDRPPSSSPSSASTSTPASKTPASTSTPASSSPSPFPAFGLPTFRLPTPSTSRPISQKTLHGSYLLDPQNPPLLNANHYKMLQQVDINESDIPPQILAEFRRQITSADETLSSISAQHKAKYGGMIDNMEEAMGKHWHPDVDQSYLRQPNAEIYDESIEDTTKTHEQNPIDPKTGLGPFGAPLGSREYRNSPEDREFILDYADLHYKQTGPLITVKRGTCIFCPPHRVGISYTNVELLHRFINERGMITNRKTNYNCAKHQRKIAWTIKRARHLGLLPYTNNWKVPISFIWGEEQQAIDDFQSAPIASDVDIHADAKSEAESLFSTVPKPGTASPSPSTTATAATTTKVQDEDVDFTDDFNDNDDALTPEQEKEMDQAEKETIDNNKEK